MQRHGGAAVGNLIRRWLGFSRLGMPKFRQLSGNSEGGIHRLIAVVAVIYKVQIAIGKPAMSKQDSRIALRLGVVEIRHYFQCIECIGKTLACVHRAFSHLMHASAFAKQFVVQLAELRRIVGKTGVICRLRSGNNRSILH